MNDDQLTDLKQLIVSTISQTETRLTQKFETLESRFDTLETTVGSLEATVGSLETKMDNGFDGIAEAISDLNQRIDEKDAETERRLTKLEQQAA